MIHVRYICYLKITFCFTETLMGISKRTSSSASEDEISTSASEDVISDARIRRLTCATLKSDEQNMHLTYSDSNQDHNQVIALRSVSIKERTL